MVLSALNILFAPAAGASLLILAPLIVLDDGLAPKDVVLEVGDARGVFPADRLHPDGIGTFGRFCSAETIIPFAALGIWSDDLICWYAREFIRILGIDRRRDEAQFIALALYPRVREAPIFPSGLDDLLGRFVVDAKIGT